MTRKPHAVGLRWKNKHTGALATLVAQDKKKIGPDKFAWVFTLEYDKVERGLPLESSWHQNLFYASWEVTNE